MIETNNGNKHLIVLQAVLAKDIYQDVASIYVEKDEAENISVQVIGDEYIYGTNYVIEPVYIYRPVIYDWFWGPYWTCWNSPWYWGYWPGWWRPYACIGYHDYYHRCHDFHHQHYGCSFHYAKEARPATHRMGEGVSRHDYATSHPEGSFATRHAGTEVSNARQLASPRQAATRTDVSGASTRSQSVSTTRTASSGASTRSGNTYGSSYSGSAATRTATVTATRTATPSATRTATPSATRSSYSGSSYSGSSTRSSYSGSSSSGSSTRSYSAGSSTVSSGYSGSSHRSSGATVSSSAASSRSAGGASTRR